MSRTAQIAARGSRKKTDRRRSGSESYSPIDAGCGTAGCGLCPTVSVVSALEGSVFDTVAASGSSDPMRTLLLSPYSSVLCNLSWCFKKYGRINGPTNVSKHRTQRAVQLGS